MSADGGCTVLLEGSIDVARRLHLDQWRGAKAMTAHMSDGPSTLARRIRAHSLKLTHRAGTSHVASALSCADILAVLYASVMRDRPLEPTWPDRDRFIMGKGHAAVALYACLASAGYFPEDLLESFGDDGSDLAGHVTAGALPGVEVSSGSLGHGLPQAVGMARALKIRNSESRVYCLLSDGDCQEGSTWEAALLAPQWSLDRLHVIVDANGQQGLGKVEDIADLEPFADKWTAFGWDVETVDGHDHVALQRALSRHTDRQPQVTIARTTKGKGVPEMEDELQWHYRSPSSDQLRQALVGLEGE